MTGAMAVVFWCLIMPVSLIVLGLRFGWPYAEYIKEWSLQVWDKMFPPPPPLPPLPKIDILDQLVRSYVKAHDKPLDRHVKEQKLLQEWQENYWDWSQPDEDEFPYYYEGF